MISAVYYILYKGAFLGLFGVCLVRVGAPLDSKKASKKNSSKYSFLTELWPVEVLYISEFSNTKLAIFSWLLRHPNRPIHIKMTFPNLQNHFLMLLKIIFQSHFSLKCVPCILQDYVPSSSLRGRCRAYLTAAIMKY